MTRRSIEEVKIDMVERFGEKVRGSKFFEDYAQIGSALTIPELYGPALASLDKRMEELLLDKLKMAFPKKDLSSANENDWRYLQGRYADPASRKPNSKWGDLEDDRLAAEQLKKLLTTALLERERMFGFTNALENVTDNIIVGLPSRFNDLLKGGHPFKDIGAGHQHGEYSHRIQWYVVTHLNLVNPVLEIYQKLPGWSTPLMKPRKFYMWEFLVDRDGIPSNADVIPFKTDDQTDFRAPSNVNRWLTSEPGQQQYPWLYASLMYRWNKRSQENLVLYVAKKMYKRTFSHMNEINDELFEGIQKTINTGIISRA